MSYKAEVIADSSGKWVSNALRFATEEEALRYGSNLAGRWTLVQEYRATESEDVASYRADEYGIATRITWNNR